MGVSKNRGTPKWMVFRGSNEQGYRRSRGIGGSCGPSEMKQVLCDGTVQIGGQSRHDVVLKGRSYPIPPAIFTSSFESSESSSTGDHRESQSMRCVLPGSKLWVDGTDQSDRICCTKGRYTEWLEF